jgi:ABC-2 type transport system ATP-binding protein
VYTLNLNLIRLEGLSKRFESTLAVDNLTLEIDEGLVFGFLGPNGAGKTTTIRMLCSLISPTEGKAYVKDFDISNESDAINIRRIIGLLPEAPGLYDSLSAYRNLDFYARLYGVKPGKREENIERFLRMLGLWERRNESVGSYSKGMKQKIAIARSLVHDPLVLFLDEPTSGLDPESAKTVRDFILNLKKEKRTIFLNTHNLDEAERICDKIGIINNRLITVGSPQDLSRQMGKHQIAIHLRKIDEELISIIRSIETVKGVETVQNKLICEVDNPEIDNPIIIEKIVRAGGQIQYVTDVRRSLEDVYLELVSGDAQ